MHIDTIYVVGAGGHAKVVADALLQSGVDAARIRVSDNLAELQGTHLLGLPVEVPAVRPTMRGHWFHVAIGHGPTRRAIHGQLLALGARPLTVVHPRATVSPFATLGQGVFVAANAIVGPAATIEDGVIVNHGAVVDHDCYIAQFAHIAPNATLAGGVHIGTATLVGAGANILPGLHIGADAVVGAGAVVLNNVLAAHTYIGVPAVSKGKENSE
jgi:sugar O-acyltransferase (sialic acid O-acetyltransferase NeuD family)